jgi:hypothetical protein
MYKEKRVQNNKCRYVESSHPLILAPSTVCRHGIQDFSRLFLNVISPFAQQFPVTSFVQNMLLCFVLIVDKDFDKLLILNLHD